MFLFSSILYFSIALLQFWEVCAILVNLWTSTLNLSYVNYVVQLILCLHWVISGGWWVYVVGIFYLLNLWFNVSIRGYRECGVSDDLFYNMIGVEFFFFHCFFSLRGKKPP